MTVRTWEKTETTELAKLRASARKATTIIQPNLPISYSLMKRHVGSYSGSSKCRLSRRRTKSTPEAIDIRAALAAKADICLVVMSGLATLEFLLYSLHC